MDIAPKHAAYRYLAQVIVVVQRGYQQLQGPFRVSRRRGNDLEDCLKQRLHTLASVTRAFIRRKGAGVGDRVALAGRGVQYRKVQLLR